MPLSPTEPFTRVGGSCPTCGAPTEPDQLVCLECGSRVALDYRRPPSWRVPVAIIVGVVLLLAVASALVLDGIGDDAEREAATTPIRETRDRGGDARRERRPAVSQGLVSQGDLYAWPRELEGFTIVLHRTPDRAEADEVARSSSEGRPAKIGVIRTDDFANLEKGFFVVFAGRYETRQLADRAAQRLGGRFPDAFPQELER